MKEIFQLNFNMNGCELKLIRKKKKRKRKNFKIKLKHNLFAFYIFCAY